MKIYEMKRKYCHPDQAEGAWRDLRSAKKLCRTGMRRSLDYAMLRSG